MAGGKAKSRFSLPAGLDRSGPKRRPIRVADAIREEVSSLLVRSISDPRVQQVGVSRVEVSDDLGHARIFYSIMGDQAPAQVAKGLESAKGFIRSNLAKTLGLRHVPAIDFQEDLTARKQEEMARLLMEIAKEDESPAQ